MEVTRSGFVVVDHEAREVIVATDLVKSAAAGRFHPDWLSTYTARDGVRRDRIVIFIATMTIGPGLSQNWSHSIVGNVAALTVIWCQRNFKYVHTVTGTNKRTRVGIVVTTDVTTTSL